QIDLFDTRCVLLTGEAGVAWMDAAERVQRRSGIPLDRFMIGASGDLNDPGNVWLQLYGVGADGAVLVRPDGHVAWRATHGEVDPDATLSTALDHVLSRA
ncbi:MAG TPA: monooxygenase, partial [Candidatus Limnocylindria bacterium]